MSRWRTSRCAQAEPGPLVPNLWLGATVLPYSPTLAGVCICLTPHPPSHCAFTLIRTVATHS